MSWEIKGFINAGFHFQTDSWDPSSTGEYKTFTWPTRHRWFCHCAAALSQTTLQQYCDWHHQGRESEFHLVGDSVAWNGWQRYCCQLHILLPQQPRWLRYLGISCWITAIQEQHFNATHHQRQIAINTELQDVAVQQLIRKKLSCLRTKRGLGSWEQNPAQARLCPLGNRSPWMSWQAAHKLLMQTERERIGVVVRNWRHSKKMGTFRMKNYIYLLSTQRCI